MTYLRRNRVQAEIAENYGVSQPTISRAISAITPLLVQALLDYVPTADELDVGTPNTTAVVLPAGYRPRFDKVFAVTGTNGGVPVLEDIFLLPGGLVFARGSAKDAVGLDGVIFSAGG